MIAVVAFGIFSLLLRTFVISVIKVLATVFNLRVEADFKRGSKSWLTLSRINVKVRLKIKATVEVDEESEIKISVT